MTFSISTNIQGGSQNLVLKINAFFHFTHIQDSRQKWRESDFCEKPPVDSADNLQVRNFVETTLSRTVCQINVFCILRQKWQEIDFCKKSPVHSGHPGGRKFGQNHSISNG